jgi:hypothetical protein
MFMPVSYVMPWVILCWNIKGNSPAAANPVSGIVRVAAREPAGFVKSATRASCRPGRAKQPRSGVKNCDETNICYETAYRFRQDFPAEPGQLAPSLL